MKPFVLLAALPLAGLAAFASASPFATEPSLPAASSQEVSVDELAWLQGTWRSGGTAGGYEETWSAPLFGTMIGMFRTASAGKISMYELLSIEADEEHGLVLRLRHFGKGMEPWASEADGPLTYPLHDVGDDIVVFEKPESGDRYTYELNQDRLTINIETTGEDPLVFRLTRVGPDGKRVSESAGD